jgi:DNA/RNA endonuclease YhcR with UshA esterase domain
MTRLRRIVILALAGLIFSACATATTMTPTSGVVEGSPILISEILVGIEGNNNYEFIEIYNASDSVINLQDWSLWYQLASNVEKLPIYVWQARTLIPPHGHFLLGRTGQDFGIAVDGEFDQGFVISKGGFELRQPDGEIADSLGWGVAPEAFTEGRPAPPLENGVSLERAPGGEQGNGADTNDNATDFILNKSPSPQNTGSLVTPLGQARLGISLTAPASVEPGESFTYGLTVVNETAETAHDVAVEYSIPVGLEIASLPPGVSLDGNIATWSLDALDVGSERLVQIMVAAPLNYLTIVGRDYFVVTSEIPTPTFGGPVWTQVEGGTLPIEVARSLVGENVTVEGVSTMYTGGFYAGSGAKFYLEDVTGGLQVYVSGAGELLEVPLDALVRVTGTIELYRGSVELIPDAVEDVEIVGTTEAWPPENVILHQAANDRETLPGRLVLVEGTATRIEEFSYSYEIDLVDDVGSLLTLYIDKLTEIGVELFEVGKQYRAIGVVEVIDIFQRLNPRLQSDITEIFPPGLLIEVRTPNSIQPGEDFTVIITVFNHFHETMTDLQIWVSIPDAAAVLEDVLDGGNVEEGRIKWLVSEIAGDGTSVSRSYKLRAIEGTEQIEIEDYGASVDEWGESVEGRPHRVFVGSGVPIWAIQGAGHSSPYKLEQLTTSGVVTGVFTELGGFWIQERMTDEDPETSAGLFVATGEMEIMVEQGDLVDVIGTVREVSQQTQIHVDDPENVSVLGKRNSLPSAISLDPPVDEEEAEIYYEVMEGMLVQVPGPAVAVGPTTKYGEYSLVLPYHGIERLFRDDDVGMLITVDDGSEIVHYDQSTLSYVVKTGDQVSNLLGPLAFTFGRYKIEPIVEPHVTLDAKGLPTLVETATEEFSVMTWNVENLFDILDPHPTEPSRPRKVDYDLALTKVANTIKAAGMPIVIGLQEVETIGILEDLADHQILGGLQYKPILLEGTDSRGIDVGYLVRGDRAKILHVQQHVAPEGLTSRPPLFIHVEMETDDETATLYVVNNHFSSLAGGEAATEPRRSAQAAWNVTILEELLTEVPGAYVAIIGDLNSFYNSSPIDVLRDAGLRHVFEFLPEDERYAYNYQGVAQTLDHILVTPSLMDLLARVDVLHVNADYPPPEPGDPSPLHKSDHDPIVATFSLEP